MNKISKQVKDITGYENKHKNITEQLKQLSKLQTVDNIHKDVKYEVIYTSKELNSLCPKTGLPDFGTLTIKYVPDMVVVEEKSLKLYLNGYRNIGMFKEFIAVQIIKDLVKICLPHKLNAKFVFEPRGGIPSEVIIRYEKNNDEEKFYVNYLLFSQW